MRYTLTVGEERLAVCRLPHGSRVPAHLPGPFYSVTCTPDELSIVCNSEAAPTDAHVEDGWRALKLAGPVDFGQTGVLESLLRPLADSRVGVFAVSTFDTDYVLIKETELKRAVNALEGAGHHVLL